MQFSINNYNQNNQGNQDNDSNNDGNNDNQNNDQVVIPPNVPVGQATQTKLAFKVEQSKILEFYGLKGKDNITAIVFIRKIDDLAWTNW